MKKYRKPKWDIHCCVCGKFCVPADSNTPFGSCQDLEPPDEEFYCARCVKNEEEHAIKTGRIPVYWQKAGWQLRAAKKLGLVQAGPEGAAWSHWFKEDKVPEGYTIWR